MSQSLTSPFAPTQHISIERAVLETLAYSDIFDFPLRVEELLRYLPVGVDLPDLMGILSDLDGRMETCCGYYFLAGRSALVEVRKKREAASRPAFNLAVRIGHLLGTLPFIRMVGLTGSLAHLNCDQNADIDYLLVAAHGRVWLARAFALLIGHLTPLTGNTLCPNLIVSDHALEWQPMDLYSARELCQMVPITGADVYARFRQVNSWTGSFLPNASGSPLLGSDTSTGPALLQKIFEYPLLGILGDRLEGWEMNRKIRRFVRQPGFGTETLFNADICQGNFNHHGLQIKEAYQQRLARLGL